MIHINWRISCWEPLSAFVCLPVASRIGACSKMSSRRQYRSSTNFFRFMFEWLFKHSRQRSLKIASERNRTMDITAYKNTPTKTVDVGGARFAYRQLGTDTGAPVIFLNHLGAVLDNWDPRVVDGIAAKHRVITFDNRGVGASAGKTPDTIQAMAKDAVTFIRALGFEKVDLLGFSMGGMIAQVIAQEEPQLVRKLMLTGTGPAGGKGIKEVVWVAQLDTVRGLLSLQDPKQFLFFTRTANGKREGNAFLARLQERTIDRDTPTSLSSYFAQL